MRFKILYAYLLLQVTVKSEEKWKWSSSSPSISSTEATTAITSPPERSYRYTGLATAKLVEADSYNVPATDHVEKYPTAIIQEVKDDSSYSSAEIRTSVNDTYQVVYSDASAQKSLQEAKDNEARSQLKEKLCRLGLAKECTSVDAKSYDYGIHPSSVSYVQPVAIVAVGEPIPAVPLGQQRSLKQSKSSSSKSKGQPASRFGGPSLLPIGPYGGNGLGGYGSFGSLGGITSHPIPARLPPAPVQHVHQHQVVGSSQIIAAPYSAPPPAAPAVYQSLPSYNPPPTVYQPSPPPYQPSPQVYQPSPPAYNPPPRQEYSNPAPAVYNPPPRQEYTNPTSVYSPPPSRPYNQISSYTNGGSSYAQREQCYCVPVDQCASYDIVGRDARNYQIDPRSKLNSTTFLNYDIVVKQPEERQYVSSSSSDAVRPRRQQSQRRQDVSSPVPEGPSPVPSGAAVDTDGRQLGSYQTCSYPQVCCRSPPKSNRYSNGAPPGTCGRRNPQGVNGRIKSLPYADGEAEFGEYPWQVAILKKDQYDNVYVCGGALVGPSHILTVAHCIKGNAPRDLRIRLGEWDVNRETEFYPHIEKDVISVIIHPEYYPGNLYNDIAVIKFEGAIDFGYNPHIAPICIPQRYQDFTGSRCWVSGWGKDAFETGGKYQNILKEVDLTVVANAECENKLRRTRLGYEFKLDHGFLCAGGEEGKDACKGDGGGPLVCESQGSWFLAGLVSWGVGCGQYDTPGVYSKVSEYSDWVKKMVVF
ncbi:hypothetical protein GHT06_020724 [Daphnia sinensis]|uniref:Peptidase S1 domain-containing protein n=1 Tax=Daphnia sinensis TaxID=1820382 RepID=A0AAD5PN54_9CRUS|nr:hypothetical protein GHT06_020724 [Daphnia sinensis]